MQGWDIMQILYALKREIKEFFPINQVPICVVEELAYLEESFKGSEQHFNLCLDLIIEEVKKLDDIK